MPKKHLYLSDDSIKIAKKFKEENNVSSLSGAIDSIIKKFNEKSDITVKSMYEFMASKIAYELKNELKNIEDKISKDIISDLKPQLNSLKFSSNSTNKDTKMLLELINGIYYKEEYGAIPASDIMPTTAYEMTKERVENKIAKEHYRKSNTID